LCGLLVSATVLSKECAIRDSLTKHAVQLARLAMMIRIGLESAEAAIPGINDLLAELAEDSPVNATFATVVRSVSCMWAQAGC
jgi:hypothetical protein